MNKHTAEPWPYFWDRNDILASSLDPESGPVVMFDPLDYERARACVNACAGMDDPAREVAWLRDSYKELCDIRADKVLFLPRPGYSEGAISINLSVAEQEGAIRDKLAEMGWARPDEAEQLRAENARLREALGNMTHYAGHALDYLTGSYAHQAERDIKEAEAIIGKAGHE